MKDFFDMLSDFSSSNFAKSNAVAIIILAVALVALSVSITIIIFNKIVFPIRFNESERIMTEYNKILAENGRLKEEMIELKNTKKMLDAANSEVLETQKMEGWEKEFLTQK